MWLEEMESMVRVWRANGNVRSSRAFGEFLRGREGPESVRQELVEWRLIF